jgi:hypothetical protein
MSLLPLGLLSQGGGAGGSGDFEFISSTILSTAQNTVTFSSIPATYRHLEFRIVARSASTFANDQLTIVLNGDGATSNYSWAQTTAQNSSGSSYSQTYGSANSRLGSLAGNGATSGVFGASKVLLTDVTATSKQLTGSAMSGYANNTGNAMLMWSGFTRTGNAALTQVTFKFLSALDFLADSRLSLYGYKG